MRVRLRQILRLLRRDESGQSLIVIVSAMTVLLGIAGFAIEGASWMVRHHDAQIVADSAALAAAQCLATPNQAGSIVIAGTQESVPGCSSSTDVSNAQQVAIDYAAANGITITDSNVNVDTTKDLVTVSDSTSTPGLFARVFGIGSSTQSARAGAGWSASANQCTSPGGSSCDFLFAENSNCQNSNNGITLTMSGNATVSGQIQSNGNLNDTVSGNISLGTGSYGPNTNGTCKLNTVYSGHNPWGTLPTQATSDYPFPVDYTKDFPPCGGSGELACQANGYPSFCTNEGSSITLTGSGSGDSAITQNIYCASGTGTKSTPSTWNGSITVTLSGNYTLYDTFVGGSVSFIGSGNDILSSCGYTVSGFSSSDCAASVPAPVTTNYPVMYATGSSSNALNITVSGGQTINGDLFAPNGTAALTMSGNKTLTTMVEANNISGTVSGTFEGDGPAAGSNGTAGPGSVSLVQ
jgi:Flp pilus assembly protein TadG